MPNQSVDPSSAPANPARLAVFCSALTALALVGAFLLFLAKNPNRVGKITVGSENNPKVQIEVSNGDNIEHILHKVLNSSNDVDKRTLIAEIKNSITSDKDLGREVLSIAEKGGNPFWWDYRTVKLRKSELDDKKLDPSLLAVCEGSEFFNQRVQVVVYRKIDGVDTATTFKVLKAAKDFPCPRGTQEIRTNDPEFLEEIKRPGFKAMARKKLELPSAEPPTNGNFMTSLLTWLENAVPSL